MLRRLGLSQLMGVLLALTLLIGTAGASFAQATPEASPTGSGSGPMLGDAVVLFDNSGNELAQIAVTQIVDPYEDADSAERGFYWVAAEVVVENLGDSDLELSTYNIQLVDEQGFTSSPGYASREDDIEESAPEYLGDPIPAGDTGGGWLFYEVIDGSSVTQVVYSDIFGDGQFVLLANLGEEIAADSTETTFFLSDAAEAGTVTVNEVITDFQDVDSEIDVARGTTIVAVDLSITNTSGAEIDSNIYGLSLVDEFGFAYSPTYVSRGEDALEDYPEFPSDEIADGDTAEGVVLYELPNDATASYVVYSPDANLIYIIAQPGDGSVVSGDTLTPVTGGTSTDGGDDEPVAEETGDCVGVAAWVDATNEAFSPLLDELDFLGDDIASADPDDVRAAAEIMADAKDAQDELEFPAAAEDAQAEMVNLLQTFEDSFNDVADRLEAGDDPADIEADFAAEDSDLFTSYSSAIETVQALDETCPDSNVQDLGL